MAHHKKTGDGVVFLLHQLMLLIMVWAWQLFHQILGGFGILVLIILPTGLLMNILSQQKMNMLQLVLANYYLLSKTRINQKPTIGNFIRVN